MQLRRITTIGMLTLTAVFLPHATSRAFAAGDDNAATEARKPAHVVLDSEKQKRIWDLEHVTFKIETVVGRPLVRDLIAGDKAAAQVRFRESFEGRMFSAPGVAQAKNGLREVRRDETTATRPADAAAIVGHLADLMRGFRRVDRSMIKVLAIDGDPERPASWECTLMLAAQGADADDGPRQVVSIFDARVEAESLDGLNEGPVFARFAPRAEIVRSSPRALFEEVTARAGLDRLGLVDNWDVAIEDARNHRYQIAVEDFDRDGFLDIAVGTTDGRPFLLRSIDGERFEDVASERGVKPVRPGELKNLAVNALVAWIDYDGDGYPDLIAGPRLFHNEAGRRFVDVTGRSGLQFDRVPLGSNVADYDGDGRLDLYIVYQKGFATRAAGKVGWVGDSLSGAENRMWRNEGGGRFRDVTRFWGAGGGKRQTFAATTFFYDDDAWPDLYLANDFGQNVLLRNTGNGLFENVSETSGATDFATSMGVASGDLDNDGAPELYVANMYSKMGRRIIAHVGASDYPAGIYEQILGSCAGNRLYSRTPGAGFHELSDRLGVNAVGWAYAPVMADFDSDGLLDLYAATGFMSFERGKPDG